SSPASFTLLCTLAPKPHLNLPHPSHHPETRRSHRRAADSQICHAKWHLDIFEIEAEHLERRLKFQARKGLRVGNRGRKTQTSRGARLFQEPEMADPQFLGDGKGKLDLELICRLRLCPFFAALYFRFGAQGRRELGTLFLALLLTSRRRGFDDVFLPDFQRGNLLRRRL